MDTLSISRNRLFSSFFLRILNGFMDYMPNSKRLAKIYQLLLLSHAHISKPLNNYHHVSMQGISLQSENIMAPDTLNREMYF